MIKHTNRVYMTQKDHQIITNLLSRHSGDESTAIEHLADELDRAEVVALSDSLPRDVVVMHSFVKYINLDSGAERTVQIVYPHEADIEQNRVSILSAVGSALIGLCEGARIVWPMPNGEEQTLQIKSVNQPES